jgi:hypothetical protein
MVQQADSTLAAIKKKVRRLTASSSVSALSEADLEQYINTFYNQDFPYAIKLDQMRSVYTFYTQPNIDRYPLDVNYDMGVREPVYVDGIQGYFFKDRAQFFSMWPRWPTLFHPITGNGVTQTFSFSVPGPFISKTVTLGGVDINGNAISVADDGNGNLLLQVPNPLTTIPAYNTPGISPIPGMHNQNNGNPGLSYQGTSIQINVTTSPVLGATDGSGLFSGNFFTILGITGTPNVVPGSVVITLATDGTFKEPSTPNGTLSNGTGSTGTINYVTGAFTITTNPVIAAQNLTLTGFSYYQSPGSGTIGTVNYVTGQFNVTFPVAPIAGQQMTLRVSQYSTGRPYSLLFWNNEFTIRPIPNFIHKVEVETYLTPVQFLSSTDNPIINQWWQYIAIGAAIKVLEDRQDMEGIQNLSVLFDRQEALVLERQSIEEVNQRNTTLYSSTITGQGSNNPFGMGWM